MSRVSLALLAALTMACDSDSAPAPPPEDPGLTYVQGDLAALGIDPATHVPGSRKADELAALAKLDALIPGTAAELADSAPGRIYAVEGNEEAARLTGIIYAIRDADQAARARELRVEMARKLGLRFERKETP